MRITVPQIPAPARDAAPVAPRRGRARGAFLLPEGRFSLARIAILYAVLFLLLPLALAAVYLFAIATPIYISESRFAVRSAVSPSLPSFGTSADREAGSGPGSGSGPAPLADAALPGNGMASHNSGQDPFLVASFIMSRDLVAKLNADGWLEARYARAGIDALSRLPPGANVNELFDYWRRHAVAAVDRRANTVLLRVRAYSAEEARDIADRTLKLAEAMVEDVTRRQRDDTLAVARSELARAEQKHEAAVSGIETLRRTRQIIDPARDAETTGALLLRLMRDRIGAVAERDSILRLGGRNAPAIAELNARIAALTGEVERTRARMTGLDPSIRTSVATLEELDALELERRFARTMLDLSSQTYQSALMEAERQNAFLLVFVPPTLPVDPSEPRPFVILLFFAGLGFVAWLFTTTVTAVVADHLV